MKKKILVVDDEASLLKLTLLRLEVSGYEAFGAADGKAGLELARQKIPDLIILDVMMEQADDGIAMAQELRPALDRQALHLRPQVRLLFEREDLVHGPEARRASYFPKASRAAFVKVG